MKLSKKTSLNLDNSASKDSLPNRVIKTQADDEDEMSYERYSPENDSYKCPQKIPKIASIQRSDWNDSSELFIKRRESPKKQNKNIINSINDNEDHILQNFRENYKNELLNVNNSFKNDKSMKGPKNAQILSQESTKRTISIQCDLILDKLAETDNGKEIDELKEQIDKKDWEIRKLRVIIKKYSFLIWHFTRMKKMK